MATQLKNITAVLGTSNSTIYTCPASTSSLITGGYISNTSFYSVHVYLNVFDTSKSTSFPILSSISIPGKSTLELPTDIYLEAGDTLTANASEDTFINVIFAVAERT